MYAVMQLKNRKWGVFKGAKLVAEFETHGEAQEYAQECVDDDRWNASNRDA